MFFFEKRNQKTFAALRALVGSPRQQTKVFCFFFCNCPGSAGLEARCSVIARLLGRSNPGVAARATEVSRGRSAPPSGAITPDFAANPSLGKNFNHDGTKDTKHSRRRQEMWTTRASCLMADMRAVWILGRFNDE
jgi:hypothetical protein